MCDCRYNVLTVNMSAQTTSNNVQDIIESRVEKRTKGVYVPLGGKKLITFMDDFNMPAKDTFGSQPPLELIKVTSYTILNIFSVTQPIICLYDGQCS